MPAWKTWKIIRLESPVDDAEGEAQSSISYDPIYYVMPRTRTQKQPGWRMGNDVSPLHYRHIRLTCANYLFAEQIIGQAQV